MDREQLYLNIISNLRDGVCFVDTGRKIQLWNHAAEGITGYSAQDIVGKACDETNFAHIDEAGTELCSENCPLTAAIESGVRQCARVFVRHRDGHRMPLLVTALPMFSGGDIVGAIEIFTPDPPTAYRDMPPGTLQSPAMHDPFTDLPSRRYLESFLSYKLDSYSRFGKLFALMFADVDNFRGFNTRHGHDIGDAVLKNIATSIKRTTKQGDLIGCWGGQELVGILSLDNLDDAAKIAEKFRVLVEGTDIQHSGELLRVTLSIGVTTVRRGDTAEGLIARAGELMKSAKQSGKNKILAD